MERETGFEPATSSLGRRRATTALLPQSGLNQSTLNILAEKSFNENVKTFNETPQNERQLDIIRF